MSTALPGSTRLAVVTGAASGIGHATARRFLAEGWQVLFVDVNPDVAQVAAAAGAQASAAVADVSTELGWQTIAAAAQGRAPVGALVSNAARQVVAPITELAVAAWDEQLAVNARGAFLGLRTFLPDLQANEGCAVLVASVHAMFGLPGYPAYAASKGALTALARQAAVDYAPVRINSVLPGPIETPIWDGVSASDRQRTVEQTALGRMGSATEVANVIFFLCSAQSSYITGASIVVDGGWSVVKDSA